MLDLTSQEKTHQVITPRSNVTSNHQALPMAQGMGSSPNVLPPQHAAEGHPYVPYMPEEVLQSSHLRWTKLSKNSLYYLVEAPQLPGHGTTLPPSS